MAGRRGRTGRGWDAAPPRAPRRPARPAVADSPGYEPAGGGPAADQPPARRSTGAGGRRWSGRPPDGAPSTVDQDGAPSTVDQAELAREICLRLLTARPRTRAELATALRRRGIDELIAAEVLDRYHDVGMVDDAAFAEAWVVSRHHGRGLARRALGGELRRRGVAPETVGQALDQLDTDTEAATARALVDRKLRTMTGQPEAIVRRLVGMLARKGYPAGLAYRVVKEALAGDERTAELADGLDPDALADAAGPDEEPPNPD